MQKGIFEDYYKEDRDLYIRDEKAIAEQYLFMVGKSQEGLINNPAVINPQQNITIRRDHNNCSETEKFLPLGWEL